jgi:hypothetical protein
MFATDLPYACGTTVLSTGRLDLGLLAVHDFCFMTVPECKLLSHLRFREMCGKGCLNTNKNKLQNSHVHHETNLLKLACVCCTTILFNHESTKLGTRSVSRITLHLCN